VKTPGKAHSIAFAGPILAGKEEPWRRFLQELVGSRSQEYGTLKQHLGVLFGVRGARSPPGSFIGKVEPVRSYPVGPRKRETRCR
jgi:hypothetical protein